MKSVRYPNLEINLNGYHGKKADIAEYCGVSQAQIGRISKGQSLPSLPLIRSISRYLNVSIDFLLKEEVDKIE